MSVLDAAYQVLKEAGQPLHYRDITTRILAAGLWQTTGKTPEATVGAQLFTEARDMGPNSRFCRVGKGIFALNDSHSGGSTAVAAPAPQPNGASGTVSFVDAAQQVLERYANHQPMHYADITKKALELGSIATTGRTPAATMYAQILTEIQRYTLRGQRPRFVKHGKGYVGLTSWQNDGLAHQIAEHNKQVRKKIHDQLYQLSPTDFEALVGRALAALGFEQVTVTSASGDGGIDVRGTLVVGDVVRTRMAVQVKRWKNNVQAPIVQQVRGSLGTHEQGLIITTSNFSDGARKEASRSDAVPVALMSGEQLVNLLVEHEIGVRRESHYLIELGEEDEG